MDEAGRRAAHLVISARDHPDARPLRVIPLDVVTEVGGTTLTIVGLIAWTTWFEIAYQLLPHDHPHDREWRVVDDAGNAYATVQGSFSAHELEVGRAQCAPALSRDAHQLKCELKLGGDPAIEVELRLEESA